MNETAEFRKVMQRHNQLRFALWVWVPLSALLLALIGKMPEPELQKFIAPIGLLWLPLIAFFTPLFLNSKWKSVRSVFRTTKKAKKIARFLHNHFSIARFKMTRLDLLIKAFEAEAGKLLMSTDDFVLFEKYFWTQSSFGWIKEAHALHEPAEYETIKVGTTSTTKHTHINDETSYSDTTTSHDYVTYKVKPDKVFVRGPFIKKTAIEFSDEESAQDFVLIFEDAVKNWRKPAEPVMDEADVTACKTNLESLKTLWQKTDLEIRQPVIEMYDSSVKDVPLAVVKSALKPVLDVDNSPAKTVLPFSPKPN
jgi:hypothetical protein